MKTKIVYVLVSTQKDYYYEQLLISVYSLRRYEKECEIILLSDKDTASTLHGKRGAIHKYISSLIIVDIPDQYTQIQKSRYIKTHVRQIISGDFLFIDTDTVVCESLKEIDQVNYDICAVADSNGQLAVSPYDDWIIKNAEKVGWAVDGKPHYNSGVMFVKDTPISHSLYEKWFENWQFCVAKGVNIDQLSLLHSNEQLNYPISELPSNWNCQIQRKGLGFLAYAKIIHYLSSNKMSIYYLLGQDDTFIKVKDNGEISEDIAELIQSPKTAFSRECKMIGGKQIEFLNAAMYSLYMYYPSMFSFLNGIANMYLRIRGFLGHIKYALHKKD